MDITEIVCENLVNLRGSKLNQSQFAKKCGLHQKTYARIENGESVASLEMLEKIARKHELSVWQLLVENFNIDNPPVLAMPSIAEKSFYKKDAETKKKRAEDKREKEKEPQ